MRSNSPSISAKAWRIILVAWLAWALLSAAELTSRMWWLKIPFSFSDALLSKLPLAVALAAITPVILALSRRFPLLGTTRPHDWGVHLVACLALIVLIDALSCALAAMTSDARFDLGTPSQFAIRVFAIWLLPVGMLYWLVVVIDHGIRNSLTARNQSEMAARLSAQVAEARLEALKLQLHPHFLFNALHSVTTLIRTGRSNDAIRVTAGLGELLRRVLDDAPVQEVPLSQELAFIEEYLSIELIRFSDRLRVSYDIAPETRDAMVPHLLLQPLVENALRHGLQPLDQGGSLTIRSTRDGEHLVLTIADDGVGYDDPERPVGAHHGLANARARLRELYGAGQSLEVRGSNGTGTQATIRLPFRIAPNSAVRAHA